MNDELRPRLYRRGRLLLPDPAPPRVDSLATIGDRIVGVGTEDECVSVLPAAHEVIELSGRTVVPGFADCHLHPLVMCVFEHHLRFEGCRALSDVLDLVADRARSSEGTVIGFQLDDAVLAERRLPTADELEAVAPGRQVVLVRRDGHHAVGSLAALRAAGFDGSAPVPAGGRVEVDDDGHPTGLVGENAVAPLLALVPEVGFDELRSGLESWTERLWSQGITAISAICQTTAEGPSGPAGELEAAAWAFLVDGLPFDIQTILIAPEIAPVLAMRSGSPLHDPPAGRRVDAVKLYFDGTLGGATACMHRPFSDRSDTSGMRTLGDEEAYARMVAAHTAGLAVCVHAIGDRANRDAAVLFDRLLRDHPGPHRHRVEHASVLDEETIDLLGSNGVAAVVQPISLRSESHWLAQRLGPERLARVYPFRSLLDAGVVVAGSSDAPIESTDVLGAMDAAVRRRGLADEQAVTPLEALKMYTVWADVVRGTGGTLGTLAPGARADVVVLSSDPLTEPIDTVEVLATVVGGTDRFVHPGLGNSLQGGSPA